MPISQSDFPSVPSIALQALNSGRIGEALRIIRPMTLESWDIDGTVPNDIVAFVDVCMDEDRRTLVTTTESNSQTAKLYALTP